MLQCLELRRYTSVTRPPSLCDTTAANRCIFRQFRNVFPELHIRQVRARRRRTAARLQRFDTRRRLELRLRGTHYSTLPNSACDRRAQLGKA